MKILHLVIIIVAVAVSLVLLGSLFITNPAISRQPAKPYSYVIHEPYQGIDKDFGTVTIQNQTFHVTAVSSASRNNTKPFWYDVYGVNFTFPDGYGPITFPDGQTYRVLVKFQDDPSKYLLEAGIPAIPLHPDYNFTTVLTNHTNPQAGFTLHDGKIQLLVNWPKIHSELGIAGLNDTYRQGQPIDFQVVASGFDYFNRGAIPDINITRPDGTVVWQEPKQLVLCCAAELTDYNRTFDLASLGGPVILNETGSYVIEAGYNHLAVEKEFAIVNPLAKELTGVCSGGPGMCPGQIRLDCTKPIGEQMAQIDKSIDVKKAISLAYTSPEFVAKEKQYGTVSYNSFFNDWVAGDPCNTLWKGVEVVFSATDKNGFARNIQVSEDVNLTKVLKVTEYQSGFS